MLEFWHTLQIPPLSQAWRDFPPIQRAISVLALALIFGNFFIRDYNRGGKRFILYGPLALVLFVYAILTAGIL